MKERKIIIIILSLFALLMVMFFILFYIVVDFQTICNKQIDNILEDECIQTKCLSPTGLEPEWRYSYVQQDNNTNT